jgi:hypothetical protein
MRGYMHNLTELGEQTKVVEYVVYNVNFLKASLNRDDNVHRHHIKPKVIFLAPLTVFQCEMSLVKGAISDFIYSRWV